MQGRVVSLYGGLIFKCALHTHPGSIYGSIRTGLCRKIQIHIDTTTQDGVNEPLGQNWLHFNSKISCIVKRMDKMGLRSSPTLAWWVIHAPRNTEHLGSYPGTDT